MLCSSIGWDGGFIMVDSDKFEEGVEWYVQYMGWECIDQFQTHVGKKAFFRLPIRDHFEQITLKSFESNIEHFQKNAQNEGHARLTFDVGDIDKTLDYFQTNNIIVSDVRELANGIKTFDISAFNGARLTAIHNPELEGEYPQARLIKFGTTISTIIGVSNLERSANWYKHNFGMEIITSFPDTRAVLMHAFTSPWNEKREPIPILLEEMIDSDFEQSNPAVRVYFDLKQKNMFFNTYELFKERGVTTSQIAGNPNMWAGFHVYDPDGNRINLWTYQIS
ncbi:VOC family protein [Cytobacillus sp. IB215665]|uniref:VOC family protein n=1 Tax=Cytobacillus sp. IB215665 TaxID=3097357 RepID=UPI002A15C815|nr:VOC family protein [Cytobacillus sp. IB215665]MDX8367091.1 VOC family protein [Cytobacillus sp. IB215665]